MPNGASVQRPPQSQPQPAHADPLPTKRDLASWWKQFKKNTRREEEKAIIPPAPAGIFGVPLSTSIRYANVAISLFDANGQSFIYGYVPIVIAKCGVYLKEKATEVAGIFRVAGAERRIKELQAIFNSPDRYGKGLDWTGYTVHDAANILRRYLNQLPEPIIPLDFYNRFREPLRNHQAQAVGEMEQQQEELGDFDPEETIRIYQQLITELPPLNRQLLLYVLDLLAVFASKSDINLMPAPNLSAIFQPGLLSHPTHDMSPPEYRLSQDVLIFLIEHQDNFLVGMQGTAVDERTIQDVQAGAGSPGRSPGSPTTPKSRTQQLVGRSASTASAGSESIRRQGGVRRNVSVNSKHSRQSNNAPSPVEVPGSPMTPTSRTSGVHRSNTVPSKKSSPAIPAAERFQSNKPPEVAAAPNVPSPLASPAEAASSNTLDIDTPPNPPFASQRQSSTTSEREVASATALSTEVPAAGASGSPVVTPSRERTLSSFFRSSPSTERDRSEGRKPVKLQKRRPQEKLPVREGPSSEATGGSSIGDSQPTSPALQPQVGSGQASQSNLLGQPNELVPPPQTSASHSESFFSVREEGASPVVGTTPPPIEQDVSSNTLKPDAAGTSTALRDNQNRVSGTTLKPGPSPAGSITSRSTQNEQSAAENEEGETVNTEAKEKRHHRWKLSMSSKKPEQPKLENDSNNNLRATGVGVSAGAERSTSTVGSIGKPRKSFADETKEVGSPGHTLSGSDTEERLGGDRPTEKRGLTGWFKGKLQELKDREAERERAKSPPPSDRAEQSASKQSLGAVAASSMSEPRSASQAESATASPPSSSTAVPVDAAGQPLAGSSS